MADFLTKKKVLILGLSCNNETYLKEERTALGSWASCIKNGLYPNFNIYFFRNGNEDKIDHENNIIYVKANDDISHTYVKTIKALALSLDNIDFDYVIITNTATILNINLIDRFVNSNLINEDYYYGCEFMFPIRLIPFFRGTFILLSKKNILKLDFDIDADRNGDNDAMIFDNFCKIDNVYYTFLSKMKQLKGISDFRNLSLKDIGSNFCINTKVFDRKNSDVILVNLLGCSSLLTCDNKIYELNKLVYNPKYITTNVGIFDVVKITDESRIKGIDW